MIVSDPKSGKSYQVEVPADMEAQIAGRRIGDQIDGGVCGAVGYILELTGGSDGSGFPMRNDVEGARKSFSMLDGGVGFHPNRKGERRRKCIMGNVYSPEIMQVNSKVVSEGPTPLEELFKKEEKEE